MFYLCYIGTFLQSSFWPHRPWGRHYPCLYQNNIEARRRRGTGTYHGTQTQPGMLAYKQTNARNAYFKSGLFISWGKIISLGFHLDVFVSEHTWYYKVDLIREVIEQSSAKEEAVQLIVAGMSEKYLDRLIKFIGTELESTPHIQFYAIWTSIIFRCGINYWLIWLYNIC